MIDFTTNQAERDKIKESYPTFHKMMDAYMDRFEGEAPSLKWGCIVPEHLWMDALAESIILGKTFSELGFCKEPDIDACY